MAIALTNIGVNNGSGTTVAVTVPAGGVPAGALICVLAYEVSGVTPTASGTLSDTINTYNNAKNSTNSSGGRWLTVFYAYNVLALTSANSITYTLNNSGNFAAVSAFYATGIQTSSDPFDSVAAASAALPSGSPSVTSGTFAVPGELVVGAVGASGSVGSFTQDSTNAAYTTPPNIEAAFSSFFPVAGGSVVQSTTTALTYNPTAVTPWIAIIVSFKPLGAAPPTPTPFFSLIPL